MGLLDSGFGLTFAFNTTGLQELQQGRAELRGLVDEQSKLSRTATTAGARSEWSRSAAMNQYELNAATRDYNYQLAQTQRMSAMVGVAVGGAFTAAGAAGASFMKGAVGEAVKLESAINSVTRVMGDVQQPELERFTKDLKGLALELPGTAADMAKASSSLARSGVQMHDLAASTKEAVSFSVASGMQMGDAANTLVKTFNIFKKEGQELPDVMQSLSNTLVAVANSAPTTAAQLANVVRRAGPGAATLGLTAQEMTGLAAATQAVGVTAGVAGTALSKAFTSMSNNVQKGADAAGVALSTYMQMTARDKTMGVINNLARLQKMGTPESLQKMSELMKGLVGSGARGTLAMNALTKTVRSVANDQGTFNNKLEEYIGIADAAGKATGENGATQKMMEKQAETLGFQMSILGAAFTNLKTELAEGLMPIIKVVVGAFRTVVDVFISLPQPIKSAIGLITAFGSAALLAVGSLTLAAAGASFWMSMMNTQLAMMGSKMTMVELVRDKIDTVRLRAMYASDSLRTMAGNSVLGRVGTKAKSVFGFFGKMITDSVLKIKYWASWITMGTGKLKALGTAARFVLGMFTGPLGWATAAIGVGVLIAKWDNLMSAFGTAKAVVGAFWRVFTEGTLNAEQYDLLKSLGLMDTVSWLAATGQKIDSFFTGFSEGFGVVNDSVGTWSEVFGFAFNQVKMALQPLWDMFSEAFGLGGDGVVAGFGQSMDASRSFGETLGIVFGMVGEGIKVLVLGFSMGLGWIVGALTTFGSIVKTIWDGVYGLFEIGALAIVGTVHAIFSDAFSFSDLFGIIDEKVKALWAHIKGLLSKIGGDLGKTFAEPVGEAFDYWANKLGFGDDDEPEVTIKAPTVQGPPSLAEVTPSGVPALLAKQATGGAGGVGGSRDGDVNVNVNSYTQTVFDAGGLSYAAEAGNNENMTGFGVLKGVSSGTAQVGAPQ